MLKSKFIKKLNEIGHKYCPSTEIDYLSLNKEKESLTFV